jgi:hypothetical protein
VSKVTQQGRAGITATTNVCNLMNFASSQSGSNYADPQKWTVVVAEVAGEVTGGSIAGPVLLASFLPETINLNS